jgi:hypothetical protein
MIFTAIILAAQPMTFNELLDLLSVKIGQEPSSRRRRTRSVVLSACSPFVEVDYDSDFVNPTLRLVHKSIGDFLLQDPANLDFVSRDCYKFFVKHKEGNAEIGKRCLTYLSYRRYADAGDVNFEDEFAEHGLLKYASIFWHSHLQRAGPSPELFNHMSKFMKLPNLWTCVQVQSKFAPHMFAKLSYISESNMYRMRLPGVEKYAGGEEYFADALPGWIGDYDDQGDHFVWSYHMFVREWGEVLVRNPDKIQQYFPKVLGKRSFWNTENTSNKLVKVKTAEGASAITQLLEPYEVDVDSIPTVAHQDSKKNSTACNDMSWQSEYIKNVLQNQKRAWIFDHSTALNMGSSHATVHRYKFQAGSPADDSDDSDSDSDSDVFDSGYDDEENQSSANEGSLWFLSVTSEKGESRWYHHISKSTALQRSLPIFVAQTSWLIWPQDDSSMLLLDLKTWKPSISTFPQLEKTDSQLISQGTHEFSAPLPHQLISF